MRRWIGTVIALAGILAARPVSAQDRGFESASGFMWGVATIEVSSILGTAAVFALAEERGHNQGPPLSLFYGLGAVMLGSVVAGVVVGFAAADAPPDVPFVTHHLLLGGAVGLSLGAGLATLASGEDEEDEGDAFLIGAVVGGIVAAAAITAYGLARRDVLLRNDDTAVGTHLMTWGPNFLPGLTSAITSQTGMDRGLVLLIAGLAGLVTYGAGIALVEANAP